jgi:hypothetical protein
MIELKKEINELASGSVWHRVTHRVLAEADAAHGSQG